MHAASLAKPITPELSMAQAVKSPEGVRIGLAEPTGSLKGKLQTYVLRIQGSTARSVQLNGLSLAHISPAAADSVPQQNKWTIGNDRFGAVTTLRVAANQPGSVVILLTINFCGNSEPDGLVAHLSKKMLPGCPHRDSSKTSHFYSQSSFGGSEDNVKLGGCCGL